MAPEAADGPEAADAREAADRREPLGSTSYELFILLISILSITNLVVIGFLPPAGQQVIAITDGVLSVFFLGDFLFRLKRAPRARHYVVHDGGWADFLAIFPFLRIFRIFRLVRVVRRLRAFGPARLRFEVQENRSTSAFGLTIFLVVLVVEMAGASIVTVESSHTDANIRNGSDAVWWAYVTITTVGYGDRFPVTDLGRLLGVLLLTSGVALFSVLTGFVANFFLGPSRLRRGAGRPRPRRPVDPHGHIADLTRLLDEQEERSRELRRRIARLDRDDRPPDHS